MENLESAIAEIKKELPGMTLRENEPMNAHTSMKVGGNVRAYAIPQEVSSLSKVCCILKEHGHAPYILGRGSNIVFPDEGLKELFLVSTEKLLGNTPLTAECGKPFVKHVNYKEGDGIDEVFGVVDDGATYRFSAVLYDFPKTKESYTTSVVIRSYVKVGDVYFYGDVLTDTVYDAAKRIPGEMVDETPFLAEIISLCED